MKYGPYMRRKNFARKQVLFTLILITIFILQSVSVNAENNNLQENNNFNENRVLSFDRPTLFMFGEQTTGPVNEWKTWNHANNVDESDSDNSFFENAWEPGGQNNGGGTREFTFKGCIDSSCNPNNESIPLIEGEFVTGSLILNIGCNSGNCRTDVSISLSMNGRDLQSIYMESGNGEGNEDRYEFIFDQAKFTDNLIPAGAEFDVRISFQKPGGFGDFYELYLQDEFTITFPMMPEVVYPIPETDFEPVDGNWKSPYAVSGSGFTSKNVQSNSIVMPIIMFTLIAAGIITFSIFSPPLNWAKIPAVILIIFSLVVPILVAPIITYVEVNKYQNTDTDPGLYSVPDLIGMQTQKNSFIGDLVAEDNFLLWVDNSYIYTNSLKNNTNEQQNIFALGFENYEDTIENEIESSKHGRMILQLYFSVLEIDPSEVSGVLINVTLVNDTTTNQIVPNFATQKDGNKVFITEENPRWVIPQESITLVGEKLDWRLYPLLGLLPAIGLLSYGIYTEMKRFESEDEVYDDYLDIE
jgi:hypothetical protein|tara:strand:+ start:1562 stop:3142 length:1581 start_codon:yes stop_codon:yes gene_type:complete